MIRLFLLQFVQDSLEFEKILMNRSMSMNYHEIVIDRKLNDNELEQFDEEEIRDYVICLPYLQDIYHICKI